MQLLQTARTIHHNKQDLCLQIAFWIWQFLNRYNPVYVDPFLKLYLTLLDNNTEEVSLNLKDKVSPNEKDRLERYITTKFLTFKEEFTTGRKEINWNTQ